MQTLPAPFKNYIRKFGLSNWKVEFSSEKLFDYVVVIPAIQESANISPVLSSLLKNEENIFQKTLFLFVINNLESSSQEVKEDNQRLLWFLRSIVAGNSLDQLSSDVRSKLMNIGLVDAASKGLEMPEKDGGVGFARKIGMDLALNYYDYTKSTARILVCLDADCLVSENYLTELDKIGQQKFSAGYFEYEHRLPDDDEEKKAIITYEIFLRYYVHGLKYAASPYAFDTIGSTMFCDAESYIKIGGMNKKKAAEDFYFMEKLAKITDIKKISAAKVFPSARRSWRVPFGTGQRINRFFAGTHDENVLHNPKCFEILRQWHQLFFDENIYSSVEYLTKAKEIDPFLFDFLVGQSFQEAWTKILNETNKVDQLKKQKYFWFDGFRTMKLIHYLRDNGYPVVNMIEALNQMLTGQPSEITNDSSFSWQEYFEYLKILRSNP
jgi:hypothetical protein